MSARAPVVKVVVERVVVVARAEETRVAVGTAQAMKGAARSVEAEGVAVVWVEVREARVEAAAEAEVCCAV